MFVKKWQESSIRGVGGGGGGVGGGRGCGGGGDGGEGEEVEAAEEVEEMEVEVEVEEEVDEVEVEEESLREVRVKVIISFRPHADRRSRPVRTVRTYGRDWYWTTYGALRYSGHTHGRADWPMSLGSEETGRHREG